MTDVDRLMSTYLGVLPRTSEEKVLRLLVDMGRQIVNADEGSLLVYDDKTKSLRFVMTTGSDESEKGLLGQSVPLGAGITGLAAATHEVQIGAPTYRNIEQTEERGGAEGAPEAVLAAPMLVGDLLVGVITAVTFEKGARFDAGHARLYAGFASIAGLVVDQRRRLAAFEEKGRTQPLALGETGRLEQTLIESIARLVKNRPEALPQITKIISAVEALLQAEEDIEP